MVVLDVHHVLAQPQQQYDHTFPPKNPNHNVYSSLPDKDFRQRVLSDAWKAAESAKSHVEELSQQIQQLKRQPLSDPVQIKELEQQCLLLLRQHMVAQQFHTTSDRLKTEL